VSVTLVDRRNHHLFQPLLYQVATASLNASDIAEPIRKVLADQPNTDVTQMMHALVSFLGRNDMTAYLVMMATRLLALHRVLKPTGSLFILA